MNRFNFIICLLFLFVLNFILGFASENTTPDYKIKSSDGNYSVSFSTLKTDENLRLFYSVSYKNKPIVEKSGPDIVLDNSVSEPARIIKPDADNCSNSVY
jgi:hypothetical protein